MKGNLSILCKIDLNRLLRIPPSPYDSKSRQNFSKKSGRLSSNMYDTYLDEDMYRSNVSQQQQQQERPNSAQPTSNNTLELNDINDKVRPTSSLERKTTLGVPVTDFSKSRIKENDYMKTTTSTDFSTHATMNGLSSDRIDEMSSKLFAQRDVKVKSESENSVGKHGKRKYVESSNSPKRENRKKKKGKSKEELEVCKIIIFLKTVQKPI